MNPSFVQCSTFLRSYSKQNSERIRWHVIIEQTSILLSNINAGSPQWRVLCTIWDVLRIMYTIHALRCSFVDFFVFSRLLYSIFALLMKLWWRIWDNTAYMPIDMLVLCNNNKRTCNKNVHTSYWISSSVSLRHEGTMFCFGPNTADLTNVDSHPTLSRSRWIAWKCLLQNQIPAI